MMMTTTTGHRWPCLHEQWQRRCGVSQARGNRLDMMDVRSYLLLSIVGGGVLVAEGLLFKIMTA